MTKCLILTILLFCSPLWATTYYVDNCVSVGNDLNKGTSPSAPWLTINKVNTSKFNPGDSILFQSTCTWREQLTVPSSGSAGSPIMFGAYGTGAAPIISGADILSSWIPEGAVYYSPASVQPNQVFLDGQRLTLAASKAALATGQWWWDSTNSYVWVYDNPSGYTIEASKRNYAIYGPCASSYITISALETDKTNDRGIYICGTGGLFLTGVTAQWNFQDGIRIDTGSRTVVTASTAAHNGANGFDAYNTPSILLDHLISHDNCQLTSTVDTAGIAIAPDVATTNATVQFSQVYNNGTGQSGEIGGGIWADTVGNGLTVQYNLVYGNNLGGILLDADNYATVNYNVVYNNGTASSAQGAGIMFFADGNDTMTGHVAYGNTLWGNYQQGLVFEGYASGYPNSCVNNLAKNNISTGTVNGPNFYAQYGCENPGTDGSGNVYTYNDFGAASSKFTEWGHGTYYSTYPAWETATGNCGTPGCSHSVQTDPQFVNPAAAQFWLQSGSPAIDAGTNLGSPYNIGLLPESSWPNSVLTGDQNAYGSGWEIGAFLYVPTITPPSNLQAVAH
jgi:hypothetical protein